MSSRNFIFVVFISLLSIQCSNMRDDVYFSEVSVLPKSCKDQAIELFSTEIPTTQEDVYAKDYYVYKDSILITINKPTPEHNFVIVSNLITKEVYNEYLGYGNGPNEMLNVMAHLQGDDLVVHDFVKHQICKISVDSAICSRNYFPHKPIGFCDEAGSPFVTFLTRDSLIMLNPYYFENKSLGMSNGESRFLTGNDKHQYSLLRNRTNRVYSYNVEQGFVIPDKNRDRIFFASVFYPIVEIYSFNQNPYIRIIGPDQLTPSFRVKDGLVSFERNVPYAYRSYAIGSNSIFMVYIGDFLTPTSSLNDMGSYIFQFDWDGNLLQTYHTDKYIGSLSVSIDEHSFYGRSFDEDGNVILLKLSSI